MASGSRAARTRVGGGGTDDESAEDAVPDQVCWRRGQLSKKYLCAVNCCGIVHTFMGLICLGILSPQNLMLLGPQEVAVYNAYSKILLSHPGSKDFWP